ncbi:Bax inhibitor-1/YccA family protein [Aristophania vespae]|uniref:Bax inhibitor-1/YccA family protein n=1 Tax=Aristophania vespae TaxID=2697033 RepID=UPI002351AF8D|nr:Bax inhibitor-1/YccA family protein [Aristophania vespae]UMM64679.1 Inner membrane protein YbhL [Aristophania vespae]
MAFHYDYNSTGSQQGYAAMDAGLRSYMLRVYNWMAVALALTGVVAFAIINTSLKEVFFHVARTSSGFALAPTLLGYVGIFSPLVFVLVLSFGVNRLSRSTAQLLFLVYSAVMGISLACIFFAYTGASVARTFFITAGLFAAVSLWGYVTKRSLTGFGAFLTMGLIGLLIAMVVNMFFASSMMSMIISFVGVLVFTGFTAYDTQRIKFSYRQQYAYLNPDELAKNSIYDALSMYLNFVNLFQFLLQFMGVRSDNR